MRHYLVIGGAGFVGSWIVEEILERDEHSKITIIDNLLSSEEWNISKNPRVQFIRGSASKLDTLEQVKDRVDFVFQLACFHGNQSSISKPLDDLENGLKPTLVTMMWVHANNPKARIVYSGAGCAVAEKTWSNPTAVSEVEQTSLIHDSPYSISKIAGEMYAHFFHNFHNIDIVRVRFQNIYGPREILGAGEWRGTINTVWRNVIPTFIYKSIRGLPIEIYGNGSRDFTYVADVAKGVYEIAMRGKAGEVYNIATGVETSITAVATSIIELVGSSSRITIRDKRNWDNSGRRLGNIKKTLDEIGFSCRYSLHEGLQETISWTKQNLALISKTIDKHSIFLHK
jgi:UDP-glucose 4-epimerase